MGREPVGAQLADQRLHLVGGYASADRDLERPPPTPVRPVCTFVHDSAPALRAFEGAPPALLPQFLGAHVRVGIHLRQDVVVSLVADMWTDVHQMDPSYWGEIALDQVGVGRVPFRALVRGFHHEIGFLLLPVDWRLLQGRKTMMLPLQSVEAWF